MKFQIDSSNIFFIKMLRYELKFRENINKLNEALSIIHICNWFIALEIIHYS